jgi:hypothetical protein
MRTPGARFRKEDGLREEIGDLAGYLEGLPLELRAGGAFAGYEARLDDLRAEWVAQRLEMLLEPASNLPSLVELSQLPPGAMEAWAEDLSNAASRAEDRQRRNTRTQYRLGRSLVFGSLCAGAAAAAAALTSPVLGTLLASGAALLAATTLVLDPFKRIQRDQLTTDTLELVRRELQSFSHHRDETRADPRQHLIRRLAGILAEPSAPTPTPRIGPAAAASPAGGD